MDKDKLVELAERLEACAEDAKRPEPYNSGFPELKGLSRPQPPSVITLANGIEAIAAALRSHAQPKL